ncbi:MAG: ABC transporter ATP-binding protein [Elusimicrobiota bacterium]
MNKKEELILTKNLEKTYYDEGLPVSAVRGVDLAITKGEFTAIVGPSGSGKTTLLNLISGLDMPSKGDVWLHGKHVTELSGKQLSDFRRDNIGLIFQAYNLIPVLNVEENIEYIMLLQGRPKQERHRLVTEILQEVGLEGMIKRRPMQLSGGQQQRVTVARAMVSKPSIILADEPTANLDSKTGGALLDMMNNLNKETDMTFVFSTHDDIVIERARRKIVLRDGKIDEDIQQ